MAENEDADALAFISMDSHAPTGPAGVTEVRWLDSCRFWISISEFRFVFQFHESFPCPAAHCDLQIDYTTLEMSGNMEVRLLESLDFSVDCFRSGSSCRARRKALRREPACLHEHQGLTWFLILILIADRCFARQGLSWLTEVEEHEDDEIMKAPLRFRQTTSQLRSHRCDCLFAASCLMSMLVTFTTKCDVC